MDKEQKNDNSGGGGPWLSVPQFGDWDQKGALPDYSMDFSKIREMRKQNKRDISRASIGNEDDLISSSAQPHDNNNNNNDNINSHRLNTSPTACGGGYHKLRCQTHTFTAPKAFCLYRQGRAS